MRDRSRGQLRKFRGSRNPGKTMSFPAAVAQEMPTLRPSRKSEGHTDQVRAVIHLPGGHRMMTGSYDGSMRVWDLHTGEQIGNDWRDGDSGVQTISLSLDGKKGARGGFGGPGGVWGVEKE